jgi:hypothetical protein
MTKPNEESEKPSLFIVCDANVVIQMTIFDSTRMFDTAKYSFGSIQVNSLTIKELERWLKGGKKLARFGKDVIGLAIQKSKSAGFKLQELTSEERKRKITTYQLIEDKISADNKSADTSDEDKELLALAEKNACFLATQETTLRSLADLVIKGRLLSFEDLVVDLFQQGQLTVDHIKSGLGNLDHFQERLRYDQKKKITSLLAKP